MVVELSADCPILGAGGKLMVGCTRTDDLVGRRRGVAWGWEARASDPKVWVRRGTAVGDNEDVVVVLGLLAAY